jgi:ApaG protein
LIFKDLPAWSGAPAVAALDIEAASDYHAGSISIHRKASVNDQSSQGIRIAVESFYVSEQSAPQRDHYFFAYRIRISNEGNAPAQLLSRHWIISDADGRVEEVRGDGVIGEQPHLAPGEAFEYTSFCPLRTQMGSMRGSYVMRRDDGSEFEAAVPIFTLAVPHALN